jgi:hypothetical protein
MGKCLKNTQNKKKTLAQKNRFKNKPVVTIIYDGKL